MVSTKILIGLRPATGIYLLLIREILSVAVTEIRLLSDSNMQKYILHGEGATLTCHYLLEPSEEVTEVEWEKNGILVYLWTLDSSPRAFDVLEGKVDLFAASPSTLRINSATIGMEGSYTCRVRTNGRSAQNDAYIMVIVDACYDNAWKTYSDRITCTETYNMHCVGMFPKPSPACGVYSESAGKFLNSVPFDSVNVLLNKTYEISFNRRFTIEEWINHTDISFRCSILVLGTPWRTGIRQRMFGDPGCAKTPSPINYGYYNLSEEKSCWGYPAEGSKVEYHCDNNYQLLGSSLHTCKGGEWVPEGVVVEGDYEVPVCRNSGGVYATSSIFWTIFVLMIARQLT